MAASPSSPSRRHATGARAAWRACRLWARQVYARSDLDVRLVTHNEENEVRVPLDWFFHPQGRLVVADVIEAKHDDAERLQ
jgi:hypothetical protein